MHIFGDVLNQWDPRFIGDSGTRRYRASQACTTNAPIASGARNASSVAFLLDVYLEQGLRRGWEMNLGHFCSSGKGRQGFSASTSASISCKPGEPRGIAGGQ